MALSNTQYDELMRHYGQVQTRNRRIHEARAAEVYAKVPQIKDFEAEIRKTAVNRAKALINGDAGSKAAYRKTMDELSEEKEALLIGAGYPADYLDELYDCCDCHDTGYISGKKCACMKKLEIELFYRQSYMDDVLDRENFSTLDFNCYDDAFMISEQGGISLRTYMDKVINGVLRKYIDDFDKKDSNNNIIFIGPSGVGKTFLIHCIAKELMDTGHSVVYLTADKLFDMLSGRRMSREDSDYENMYQLATDSDLLIIDDLGTEFNNSLTNSELFNCINDRILRRKAVIISTNLRTQDIREIYSERVASRIFSNYKYIPVYGNDLRTRKKKSGR